MKLLIKNKKYRLQVISRFISDIGEYLFNIVFVVYAANVYKSELAVSIASIISLLPIFLELYTGLLADVTKNKKNKIYIIGWIQAILFLISYFFIGNNSVISFATLSLINFTSDSIGLYLDNLEYTFFHKIVNQDEIREASLFNQVMYRIKSLIGPALGVWLLSVSNNNYGFITLVNSATFVIYAIFSYKLYSQLDEPRVAKKENFKIKFKQIFNNIINIFEKEEETKGFAKKLIITESILGGLSTATNNMLRVSFVLNPLFYFSFEKVTFMVSILTTITAIFSGLFSNDRFSKMSFTKLTNMSLVSFLIATVLFFINSDISRVLGYLCSSFSFYVRLKMGPTRTALIFKNIPEENLASVTSTIQFISMISLPIITTIMLLIYNINKNFAWSVSILIIICNILLLKNKR